MAEEVNDITFGGQVSHNDLMRSEADLTKKLVWLHDRRNAIRSGRRSDPNPCAADIELTEQIVSTQTAYDLEHRHHPGKHNPILEASKRAGEWESLLTDR